MKMCAIKMIKKKVAPVLLLGMTLFALPAFSQEAEEGVQEEIAPVSGGSSSSLWQNSAGSTVGTREDAQQSGTARPAADPRLGPGGGSIRPGAAARPDPGGNPDVPFDENMNLAFLAAGVIFAAVVVRKKYLFKPAVVNNK